MKQTFFLTITTAVLALTGCKEGTKSGYYDLNRGESVSLVKDENTGLMVNAETKKPAYIYVNEETNDTIFGATGKVINGNIIKLEDGKYKYEDLKVNGCCTSRRVFRCECRKTRRRFNVTWRA